MPRVVISDTSPLRYLILIGHTDLLPTLYSEIFLPETVAEELNQPATPELVRRWIPRRPSWLQIVPLPSGMLCSRCRISMPVNETPFFLPYI